MKYPISYILSVNIPDIGGTVVTVDKEADFEQIILEARRVNNGVNKVVKIRLVNVGSKVETEFWEDNRLKKTVRINHDDNAHYPIDSDIRNFLFG